LVIGVCLIGLSIEVEKSYVIEKAVKVAELGRCDWFDATESI
jgi:hypothetical protein